MVWSPASKQQRHERRRLPHVDQDHPGKQQHPVGEYGLADQAYGVGHVVDDPDLVLEHQPPHHRGDDRREGPRHQHRRPDEAAAREGPVYRERYGEPDHELEEHADHREDQGVRKALEEVRVLEHLDVVLEPYEGSHHGDRRLAQAQVYGLKDREDGHDEDDHERRQDHVVGRAPLGIAELLPEQRPAASSRCLRSSRSPLFYGCSAASRAAAVIRCVSNSAPDRRCPAAAPGAFLWPPRGRRRR